MGGPAVRAYTLKEPIKSLFRTVINIAYFSMFLFNCMPVIILTMFLFTCVDWYIAIARIDLNHTTTIASL